MTLVMAYRSVLLVAVLAFTASACGNDDGERFLGDWERNGDEVPRSEIQVFAGPSHCDWQEALILNVAWPLDGDPPEDAYRGFVRDPNGVMADYTAEPFDSDADLPDDAEATGYENDAGVELWLADDDATAYLVDGDAVEAWPVLDEGTVCA